MTKNTIEGSLAYVGNRFKLVILASQRAHDLSSGASLSVEREGDKNTVIALREIAANKLNVYSLFNLVVHRCKKYVDNLVKSSEVGVYNRNNSSDNKDLSDSTQDLVEDSVDTDVVMIGDDLSDDVKDLDDESSLFAKFSFNDDDISADD